MADPQRLTRLDMESDEFNDDSQTLQEPQPKRKKLNALDRFMEVSHSSLSEISIIFKKLLFIFRPTFEMESI